MVQHDLCVGAQETTARQRQAGKGGRREAGCVALAYIHVTSNRRQQHLVRKKKKAKSRQSATSGSTSRATVYCNQDGHIFDTALDECTIFKLILSTAGRLQTRSDEPREISRRTVSKAAIIIVCTPHSHGESRLGNLLQRVVQSYALHGTTLSGSVRDMRVITIC